jgi:hypothetical protein
MIKRRLSSGRTLGELIKEARYWSLGQGFRPARATELRQKAILSNHAYYFEHIPAYQKLAKDEGIDESADIETIKKKLMLPDDIFKSYHREWLDSHDFARMDRWLSGIYHQPVQTNMPVTGSVDNWLDHLATAGVFVTYSSGTSGTLSFVPRDKVTLGMAKTANMNYLAPLLGRRWPRDFTATFQSSAFGFLSPDAFNQAVTRSGLPDFDAALLGFRSGRLGNQALMEQMGPLFRRCYFLYDTDITIESIRATKENNQTFNREQRYLDLIAGIETSTGEGQKVFIFGAPHQFRELCAVMSEHGRRISLKKGSLALFGGGWKSFTGETLEREVLASMLADAFDLPPERIIEGYSMTEISVLLIRCDYGRFHIPPLIEPVLFDDALDPIEGKDVSGSFGFLDPMAWCYPGFIISGDYVHMVDGPCECGLTGPAITDIGRARNREVKGCGGIMGSVGA